MDKLERYLDQVCRGVGGPRALRLHLRQELREHLLDAVAEYRAVGLSDAEALDRALDDFGGPEQVRSELEATHGHRVLGVVIDKAMQWKENTMKAKWLWSSWAHLAIVSVLALEVMWITCAVLYFVPKFQRLLRDGYVDATVLREQQVGWMPGYLAWVSSVGDHATPLVALALVAWGLFEWRVRSENKSLIRLSALGSAAVGLVVVSILLAGALVVPFLAAMPAMGRVAQPFTQEQVGQIDRSLQAMEQALAKKDWDAMDESSRQAAQAIAKLDAAPVAFGFLAARYGSPTPDELRGQLKAAGGRLGEARQAIVEKDVERVKEALRQFHESYAPIATQAKKVGK